MDQKRNSSLRNDNNYSVSVQLSELLFAMLPFAVVFLVGAYKQWQLEAYIMAPEWAFAAALLFGQTIVKIVSGTAGNAAGFIKERVVLIISILIVPFLVPSLVLLAILLTAPTPPLWIGYVQVVLAFIAAFLFVGFGATFHTESTDKEKASL